MSFTETNRRSEAIESVRNEPPITMKAERQVNKGYLWVLIEQADPYNPFQSSTGT